MKDEKNRRQALFHPSAYILPKGVQACSTTSSTSCPGRICRPTSPTSTTPPGSGCPTAFTTRSKGHDLYRDYIDTLAYAEELGFDGICVNEHHQTAYGLMPSPNLIAAALTQRTSRCKLAVIGNALPMYNPPLRVAEEFAMLDVMSGGRLVAGMVIGGGPEYFAATGQSDLCPRTLPRSPRPDRQGLDDAGAVPVELEALLLSLRQIPGRGRCSSRTRRSGSPEPAACETIEFVAQRRYSYMGIPYFPHRRLSSASSAMFREACDRAGYTAAPEQMGWGVPIYVAETDKQAREEFEPHFWYFVRNLLKNITLTPPGYTSPKSAVAS